MPVDETLYSSSVVVSGISTALVYVSSVIARISIYLLGERTTEEDLKILTKKINS